MEALGDEEPQRLTTNRGPNYPQATPPRVTGKRKLHERSKTLSRRNQRENVQAADFRCRRGYAGLWANAAPF